MIVEVFARGSHFEKLFDTFWNIKTVHTDGYNFILVKEDESESIILSTDKYELRMCY